MRDEPAATRPGARLAAHLFVVGFAVASAAWVAADALKRRVVAPPAVLGWAALFHHPEDAALLPYVASALAAFAWGLALYLALRPPAFRALRRLRRLASARSPALLLAIAAAQATIVLATIPAPVRGALAAGSLVACFAPAWRRRGARPAGAAAAARAGAAGPGPRIVAAVCVAGTAALLVAIAVEPVRVALRPARLLNEYTQLPQREAGGPGRPGGAFAEARREEPVLANRGCEFAFANPLEYALQSTTRGQMNHIGHVLNPWNEYDSGKPLDAIYFQYGLGATFVFKWVTDLFGGPSLQTWYKTLLLFLAYWAVFVAAAVVLLRDARHVLLAVALLAANHYALGYEALLLAPGINPLLHFLDLPVLLAALAFFRSGRWPPLALAAVGAAAAVTLNGLFGAMTVAALAVSAGMHVLERAPGPGRARRLAGLAALVALPLAGALLAIPDTGGASVRALFSTGFFSWRPPPAFVLLTLAYVVGSYLFLLWSRASRDASKYATVYLFVYAQGFLVYAFWSGLESHFWPAIPYVGLHLLLMLRTLAARSRPFARREGAVLAAALLAIAALLKVEIDGFVRERNTIGRLFRRWETHRWPFARARVVATADPAPVADALAQIERYSAPGDRSVALVSTLDGLLPFLAGRHSVFPHFDLQWSLVTEEDVREAAASLARARPRYVLVGREVEGELDAGCRYLGADERRSLQGRLREMARVFAAVSGEYERIETGALLSVYGRIGETPADDPPAAAPLRDARRR